MKTVVYGKFILLVILSSLLSACFGMRPDYSDQSYSQAPIPAFDKALEYEQWVRDELATYKSRRGYKAFAIAIQNNYVVATGFGDDKVSMEWADTEAMRMCQHYSQGQGECMIIDRAESEGDHGLSQAEIDTAPRELIAHRDIRHYLNYQQAHGPKAFVVAACSGQAFWVDHASSRQQAEQKALANCEAGRHPSDPCCTVLTSE